MTVHFNHFPKYPRVSQPVPWARMALRLLGLLAWLLLGLLCLTATGCGMTEQAPPTATVIPFPTFTPTPVTEQLATSVTISPRPTPAPLGLASLPAPLYFLNVDGQIMRLETDGETAHQVTTEATPIITFDVDPTGIYLVYVSNNDLIRTTVWGEDRQLLFAGGPLGEVGTIAYYTNNIQRVSFAPDGKRLALAWNGIQLFHDITASDPAAALDTLLPNGPDPALPPGAPLYFLMGGIHPYWSPDGKHLFIASGRMNSDALLYLILDVQTREVVEVKLLQPEAEIERSRELGLSCRTAMGVGDIYWDRAAAVIYSASDFTEMFGPPGLSVINLADGTVAPLFYAELACHAGIAIEATPSIRRFRTVYQTTTGMLWGIVNTIYDPALPHLSPMTMAHLDPATKEILPLRNDSYYLGYEILWAEDDSGAVVIVHERKGDALNLAQGQLLWLPSDGTSALDLAIDGKQLQWGR